MQTQQHTPQHNLSATAPIETMSSNPGQAETIDLGLGAVMVGAAGAVCLFIPLMICYLVFGKE